MATKSQLENLEKARKAKKSKKKKSRKKKIPSPLQAIRIKCRDDCCAKSTKEVKLCDIKDCPLWPYRFGMRPETAKKRGYPVE